ncbi:MAG: RNA-binding protein [Gammaproteobacteria bacterium]
MEIFVGNLPRDANVADLRHLFGHGTAARFRVVQKRCANGTSCCYGCAVIGPERLARRLIAELDGLVLRGRRLQVRPFRQRNGYKERRAPPWRGQPWFGVDRRKSERRNGDY